MKRKIAFILMTSLLSANCVFAESDNTENISLTFNADMFLTSGKAAKSYADGKWYYDGSNYGNTVTLGGITYNLTGLDTKEDDVIKIDTNDVTVNTKKSALKKLGLILFSREEQTDSTATVTVNYEGGKTEDYKIEIPAMTDENDEKTGYNPLKVTGKKGVYTAAADTSDLVYLNDVLIDMSKSVNKNLNVESVTLKSAKFTYYLAAMNQFAFSASEIEEQTQQAVKDLYSKYSGINFKELYEGKDGAKYTEAQELYSAMLKQEGKMELASEENVEKIDKLIKSYELYAEIKEYKDKIETLLQDYPEKSSDFTELSQTDLNEDDFKNLQELLELYNKAKTFDSKTFNTYLEYYNTEVDISIDFENEVKIKTLHDAYEKAAKKEKLKGEIDKIYPAYKDKDIEDITEADKEQLEKMIGYFDEAKKSDIDFSEYNEKYIRHLYNDYAAFKTSEERKAIDITKEYNVDVFGVNGETANADTWYECSDNLAGERFATAGHFGIASYDKSTGIIYLNENEYKEDVSYDPITEITTITYPFTATGKTIPFYMPEKVFNTAVCDGLLIKSGGTKKYTFDMSGDYTDKLYFVISAKNQGNVAVDVNFTDGTKETYSVYVNTTGQTVNAVRNKNKSFPDMVNYVTSGNYKDQSMAATGVIYEVSGNTTNGLSTFAVNVNKEKIPVSVTFSSTTFDYVIFGAAEKPVDNSVLEERVETLWAEIVKNGAVLVTDSSKISEFVLNYSAAQKRGLYFENIDEDIVSELSGKVLTAKGSAKRESINSVKAEIEFSVPVSEDKLDECISVVYGGENTEFNYELDKTGKKLTLYAIADREGGKEMKITVSKELAIASYPNIKLLSELNISYNVPEYLTAEMSSTLLKLTNNSNTSQNYFAFATVTEAGAVKGVVTAEGTIAGDKTANVNLDTTLYNSEGTIRSIAVLDKNTLALVGEVSETETETAPTNKTADYKQPSLNLEEDILKIEGITSSKQGNKAVAVVVSLQDDSVIYAGVKKTNNDGYFNMEIPISTEKIFVSGNLKIKIGGDDFSKAEEINDLYFPVLADRTDVAKRLKNAKSVKETETILKEAEEKLSLNFVPFKELMKSGSETLANRIINVNGILPEISDDDSDKAKKEKISTVQNIIMQQSVLEAFAQNKSELVAANGELLYGDVMAYGSIDKNGVTLYSLYQNKMSEKGKKAVADGLLGNNYKTTAELYNDFAKFIMLNILKNPKESGVGHIKAALTKENAVAADITITKYLNLSDTSKADGDIANMNIYSLSDVENYIKNLSDEVTVNKSSGTSTSGNSGGGISFVPSGENIANLPEDTKAKFDDVSKNHWAYEAIEDLSEKGIINGKGNGIFEPESYVTRAEFVKILCIGKSLKAEGSISFKDVLKGAWYEEYVVSAYNLGLVRGVSEDEFGVDMPISRQDICTILFRAKGTDEKNGLYFEDNEEIAEYAQDAVAFFAAHGVVNGFSDGTFRPNENCTRAQAAKIIYNYLNM